MRIVVCGSRTWEDEKIVHGVLSGFIDAADYHPLWDDEFQVAHGAAKGADAFAGNWAQRYADVEEVRFPADWEKHGKKAGFLRNQQMIEEFQPNVVLAFSEWPITKGTQHTVDLAKKAGIPVYVISHGGTTE